MTICIFCGCKNDASGNCLTCGLSDAEQSQERSRRNALVGVVGSEEVADRCLQALDAIRTTKMISRPYPVSDLRRAYNKGKAIGRVGVKGIGLTYLGKPVEALDFQRYGKIEIVGVGNEVLALFQDTAYLDD